MNSFLYRFKPFFLSETLNVDYFIYRLIFPIVSFVLFGLLVAKSSGLSGSSYSAFLIPGIVFEGVLLNSGTGLIDEIDKLRNEGKYSFLSVLPMGTFNFFLPLILSKWVWACIESVLLFVVCNYWFGVGLPLSVGVVWNMLLIILLLSAALSALALLLASFGTNQENILHPVIYSCFRLLPFVSGAYYGIEWMLNKQLEDIVYMANPFAGLQTMMREILVYHSFSWTASWFFLAQAAVIILLCGWIGIYRLRNKKPYRLRF